MITLVQVTNRIGRGEIILPTINGPLKAGDKFSLDEEQLVASDICYALEKEMIVVLEQSGASKNVRVKNIKVKNISGQPLSVHTIGLLPNEVKLVDEDDILNHNVQIAIEAGLIEVIEEKRSSKKVTTRKTTAKKATSKKTTPKDKKLTKKTKKKTRRKSKSTRDKEQEEAEQEKENEKKDSKSDTTMGAWNPHSKSMMTKDQTSLPEDGYVPEVLQEDGDIKFVDVEESKGPRLSTKKSSTKKSKGMKASTRSKGLKPVGRQKVEKTAMDALEEGFVDVEQDSARLRNHPILGQNTEIE